MAELITFRTVSLHGDNYCLDVVRGLLEPADVRGKDAVAPGREGKYVGNRVAEERNVLIEGYVRGVGTTLTARRQSFHETTQTLMSVFLRDLDPGPLVLEEVYGIPVGETWTLQARTVDAIGSIPEGWSNVPFQEWSIKLIAVDPPEWAVT